MPASTRYRTVETVALLGLVALELTAIRYAPKIVLTAVVLTLAALLVVAVWMDD